MGRCVVCGTDEVSGFTIETATGLRLAFDSFECAIDRLAPRCAYCGVRIVGHGYRANGSLYCGGHCAEFVGIDALV
jgi:hypothetical protein